MRYRITLEGLAPIIHHCGTSGLDTRSPAALEMAEIARKKASNRTEADDIRLRQLECQRSLWLDECGNPTVPASAVRAVIEGGARKLRQGPQVREGLVVESIDEFRFDTEKYGTTLAEWCETTQFVAPVVVRRNRILRTRAKFNEWALTFTVEVDPELIDQDQLLNWLDIGGRRLGLGDWRPQTSGTHGRFEVKSCAVLDG